MIYSYAFSDNMEKGFGTSIFFAHINTTILNSYSNRDMYIEVYLVSSNNSCMYISVVYICI